MEKNGKTYFTYFCENNDIHDIQVNNYVKHVFGNFLHQLH